MTATADTTVFPPFTVTRAAIDQLTVLGGAVRIDVEDGGCSGATYTFAQVNPHEPVRSGEPSGAADPRAGGASRTDDTAYGCPGAWLVVSDAAAEVLAGATLDYAARLKPPRFRVLGNPNTAHVCPCRRSFGQEWPGPRQPTCRSYQPMPWDETFDPPTAWKRQTGYDG